MKELQYEFVEIESDSSFLLFGRSLGGVLKNTTLHFNNELVQGQVKKINVELGLWIRTWKLTTHQKITLRRLPAPSKGEIKFSIVFFVNPSLFELKQSQKKVHLNSQHNILFLSNSVPMDFSVLAKHPFYVLDVTFTDSWLLQQLAEPGSCFDNMVNKFLVNHANHLQTQSCNAEDYKILHELETSLLHENEDTFYIRSRVYKIICSFFSKVVNSNKLYQAGAPVHYDQVVSAKKIVLSNLKALPNIKTIAHNVNMSVSTLIRHFKSMYGKSIYEYWLEQKMEWAKKLIVEQNMSVKETAAVLGYKQASPFIEAFKRSHGFSPGSLKANR